MIRSLILKYYKRPMSQWLMLLADMLLVVLMFFFSKLLNYWSLSHRSFDVLVQSRTYVHFAVVSVAYLATFMVFKPFKSIMRYTGFNDVKRIFLACCSAFGILLVLKVLSYFVKPLDSYMPWGREIVLIAALILVGMVFVRLLARFLYDNVLNARRKETRNIVIYGAGDAGKLTHNILMQDVNRKNSVVAFVDDNSSKSKKELNGVPILLPKDVLNEDFIAKNSIDELIIAIPSIKVSAKQNIINRALGFNIEVKSVPEASKWIDGQLSVNQIKNINIEDLLARDPIVLENTNVANELAEKVILVTGAAGSIGSEISRQLCTYGAKRIILLDNAESPLFDLRFELTAKYPRVDIEFVIADVRDKLRLEKVFEGFRPDIVYHAAAYKHVPFMEEHPYEAVSVNVFGTKNMADLAIEHGVRKFVMISTDKAVNPTNVMGATKRVAEIYTQSHTNGQTHFVTTRFGNVLGSSGSVIPLFKKQLEQGGPLTVTHRDITRYFMTIPEACNLVLEAGAMGSGGDIFVFDMGQPVRIYDLARNMIRLSGLQGVEIKEVGLRPGEKLYEELLATKENTLPTHHPKILRAKVREYTTAEVDENIGQLLEIERTAQVFDIVAKLKSIVPEFVSNNSVFGKLDK